MSHFPCPAEVHANNLWHLSPRVMCPGYNVSSAGIRRRFWASAARAKDSKAIAPSNILPLSRAKHHGYGALSGRQVPFLPNPIESSRLEPSARLNTLDSQPFYAQFLQD